MERLLELWEDHKKYCVIGIGIIVFIIGGYYFQGLQSKKTDTSANFMKSGESTHSNKSSGRNNNSIYVDVKGSVNHPGVYKLRHGLRVQDALTSAGGATNNADVNHVNMAKQVSDQQVVYVPALGEVNTPIGQNTDTNMSETTNAESSTSSGPVININTATKEQLTQITGIGDKKADLILQYRQEHGEFKSVDDLKNINGFGDKSVSKIKDQIAV
ncbi:helix-hairpin-helix domain-containing protein [Paucilactobacillus suebicus]|uniref:Competence protein n=1 Tax=Paucilactobacillus suebicus DSM 5007 = KCTC 3549 TaxID=1423807 RepID=A0A0R1W3V8_9LACO|nr:helix-hairpin-helix domain-containing protein [Paucilactobacillus suebicus]KRM12513.1 competence protein [Paucilactobacillus suebicus DSM 5007 = KCTC 3549]